MFQVLSTVQQTRVIWTLSVKTAVPWCNSLQNLEMAWCEIFIFILEDPIWRFQCFQRTDSYSWKTNTHSTSWCLGWSLVTVTLYLHSSSHMVSESTWRPTTTSRTQYWSSENFCHQITPNIWQLNSLDYTPLDYYVWAATECESNKNACNTKY